MLRWLGAGLILCGGLAARRTLLEGERRAQRTRRELAAALEAMRSEIRLLLTPIPTLLLRTYGGEADAFFASVSERLRRGEPLGEAWRRPAEELPLPDAERQAVSALGARLDDSEEGACAALALCASALRRSYEASEAQKRERERLTSAICISISLFFAIILF